MYFRDDKDGDALDSLADYIESDEQFELEKLNNDEHEIFDSNNHSYNIHKENEFVDYAIDECKCRILIPDNHTIKKVFNNNGSISYVGLIDMGMYALTFKKIDKNLAKTELDSFFSTELQKLNKSADKTVLHSDFVLNGFNMKEMITFLKSDLNKIYSVQRVTFDSDLLYKIEFFGVINSDINYLSASKFLNSLQKQYQVEI